MDPPQTFRFRPGGARTEVAVGEGALGLLAGRLPRIAPGRWFAVSSRPVFALHGTALLEGASGADLDPEPFLVPDGEKAKSWAVLGRLLSELAARGLKRDGGLLALGGGTVGDVAGLAASLALRGVPVVQVPTTLLAAADSALGGKTAVDLPAGKNLAGTVHHPALVLADTRMLLTLPDRAFRSGLAEVVKSSMLDASFDRSFPRLEGPLARRELPVVTEAVWRSLRMKARVVGADPLETRGIRASLNLGHTVGHALETASGHRLAHGEAVAWGLLSILPLSTRRAGLAAADAERLAARVVRLVGPPPLLERTRAGFAAYLGADKKADRRGPRVVLLAGPGAPRLVRCRAEELSDALSAAAERYNTSR